MKTLSDNHVFKYTDDFDHFILVDRTGAASGEYLKALKYRSPETLEQLRDEFKRDKPEIGESLVIKGIYFLVGRKHYRSKWDLKGIEKGLDYEILKNKKFKSLNVDYPQEVIDLLDKNLDIEWKTEYKWGSWSDQ